jgi:hypothetical protein
MTATSSEHVEALGGCRGLAAPGRSSWPTPGSQAQEFAADSLVAPPRILRGEPHDQLLHLVRDRRSPHGHGRVGPPSAHHAPVPAEQRLRLDQEHRPAGPREVAAQRREQRAILGLQSWPRMLATQHRKLVAQHQDLDFLGLGRPAAQHDQLKDAAPTSGRRMTRPQAPQQRKASKRRTYRSPTPSQTRWSPAPSTSGTPRA